MKVQQPACIFTIHKRHTGECKLIYTYKCACSSTFSALEPFTMYCHTTYWHGPTVCTVYACAMWQMRRRRTSSERPSAVHIKDISLLEEIKKRKRKFQTGWLRHSGFHIVEKKSLATVKYSLGKSHLACMPAGPPCSALSSICLYCSKVRAS